jgi:tetratricopeptide (TPR) repeat protein
MTSHWYYVREERVFGPISSSELRCKARESVIDRTTPVRRGSDGPWVPARRVQGLFDPAHEASPKLPTGKPSRSISTPEATYADLDPGEVGPPQSEDRAASTGPSSPGRRYAWIVGASAAILVSTALAALVWSVRNPEKGAGDSSVGMQPGGEDGRETPRSGPSTDTANAVAVGSAVQPVDETPAAGAVADDGMISNLAQGPTLDPEDNLQAQAPESLPRGPSVAKPESPSLLDTPAADPAEEDADADPTPPKGPSEVDPVRSGDPAQPQQEDERLAMLRQIYEGNRDLFGELAAKMPELERLRRQTQNQTEQAAVLSRRLAEIEITTQEIGKEMAARRREFGPNVVMPEHMQRLILLKQEYLKFSGDLEAVKSDYDRDNKAAQGIEQTISDRLLAAEKILDECFYLYDPFGRLHEIAQRRTVDTVSRWILEDTEFPPFYLARGFAHAHLGEGDRALEDFGRATELYPRMASFTTAARGYVLARQGKIREASNEFDLALKLNPKLAVIYVFQGYAWLEQQDRSKAQRQFVQALRYDKNAAFALQGLAFIWSTQHHSTLPTQKKAVDHARNACELTKWRDWSCVDTLAMAFAAAGEFESAVQTAKQALHITPAESRAEVQRRLRLYQQGKPYRPDAEK